MKVKEAAILVEISVRTLHHYDEIGLLIPEETTEAGFIGYTLKKSLDFTANLIF
jgi:DNA-binding transcriptional MerR regulator